MGGGKGGGSDFDMDSFNEMLAEQQQLMADMMSQQTALISEQMAQQTEQHAERMQLLQDQIDAQLAEQARQEEESRIAQEQANANRLAAEQAEAETARARAATGRRALIVTGGRGVTDQTATKKKSLLGVGA